MGGPLAIVTRSYEIKIRDQRRRELWWLSFIYRSEGDLCLSIVSLYLSTQCICIYISTVAQCLRLKTSSSCSYQRALYEPEEEKGNEDLCVNLRKLRRISRASHVFV